VRRLTFLFVVGWLRSFAIAFPVVQKINPDVQAFGGRNRYTPGDEGGAGTATTAAADADDDEDEDEQPRDELKNTKKKKKRRDDDDDDDDEGVEAAPQDADMQRLMAAYAAKGNTTTKNSTLLMANKHASSRKPEQQQQQEMNGENGLSLRHTHQPRGKVNMAVLLNHDSDDEGLGGGGGGDAEGEGELGALHVAATAAGGHDSAPRRAHSDEDGQQQQWQQSQHQQQQHPQGEFIDFDQAAAASGSDDAEDGLEKLPASFPHQQHLPGQMLDGEEDESTDFQQHTNGHGTPVHRPYSQHQQSQQQHLGVHQLCSRTTSLGGPDRGERGGGGDEEATALGSAGSSVMLQHHHPPQRSGRGQQQQPVALSGRGTGPPSRLQQSAAERDEFDF
jgi:hypothetical protein